MTIRAGITIALASLASKLLALLYSSLRSDITIALTTLASKLLA